MNRLARYCLGALVALAAGLLAGAAGAQTVNNSFGGLSQNSDKPIDIEADMLTVYDAQKYAVFSGKVKAVQGTTTLHADKLKVQYVGGNAIGAPASAAKDDTAKDGAAKKVAVSDSPADAVGQGAKSGAKPDPNSAQAQITKINATGNVVINSANDQTTTSDWAIYDVPAQMVTVGGNVVLTQGKNVLKGNRLVINLKTGESQFVNIGDAASNNRIRALFMPKQDSGDDDSDKKKSKKSGQASASKHSTEDHTPQSGPVQLVPQNQR